MNKPFNIFIGSVSVPISFEVSEEEGGLEESKNDGNQVKNIGDLKTDVEQAQIADVFKKKPTIKKSSAS